MSGNAGALPLRRLWPPWLAAASRGAGKLPAPIPSLPDLVVACQRQAVRLLPLAELQAPDSQPGSPLYHLVESTLAALLPPGSTLPVQAVLSEMLGYGPLGPLLADPLVTEVMVNGPDAVFVERDGVLRRSEVRFADDAHLLFLIGRLVGRAGRRIDTASPTVDACLPDGARLHAVIPPVAVGGASLTIRKAPGRGRTLTQLVSSGSISAEVAEFLSLWVRAGANILVSGSCGAGKTTTLRALAAAIPTAERVITIEDEPELALVGENVVPLAGRPADMEGRGAIALRDLLKGALRMRPDRLVVGEVRGTEACDLLQAMAVGHSCFSTLHASGTQDALERLASIAMLAAEGLDLTQARAQVARTVEVVVHQMRSGDGRRYVGEVALVHRRPEGPEAVKAYAWYPGRGFCRPARVAIPAALAAKLAAADLAPPPWFGLPA